MNESTAETIDPADWFVIAIDADLRRIERDIRRLEEAYPGRYEVRVGKVDDGQRHEVAVRHRG